MKEMLLVTFLFIATFACGQKRNKDSIEYFQRQIWTLERASDSILKASPAYQVANEGLSRQYVRKRSSEFYSGFTLFSGLVHSDVAEFNASLSSNGHPGIRANCWQGGFGISSKISNLLLDVYFVSFSGSKSTREGHDINATLSNFLQIDFGYDFLPGKWIAIYPYAGLSIRNSKLRYSRGTTYDPNFTSITDIVADQASVHASSTRLGYQAGMGFDLLLFENRIHSSNVILFVKTGLNRPIWPDRYEVGGYTLPSINQGVLAYTFGIKFGELQ